MLLRSQGSRIIAAGGLVPDTDFSPIFCYLFTCLEGSEYRLFSSRPERVPREHKDLL